MASVDGAVPGDTSIARPETSELTRSRVASAWLFLAPMLVLLVLVAGWPLVRTIWFGFTDANLADLSAWKFIGFDNYLFRDEDRWVGLLVDPEWWRAVWNTVKFTVISVTLETILGMVVALVLNANFPGRGVVRAAVLIPGWDSKTRLDRAGPEAAPFESRAAPGVGGRARAPGAGSARTARP